MTSNPRYLVLSRSKTSWGSLGASLYPPPPTPLSLPPSHREVRGDSAQCKPASGSGDREGGAKRNLRAAQRSGVEAASAEDGATVVAGKTFGQAVSPAGAAAELLAAPLSLSLFSRLTRRRLLPFVPLPYFTSRLFFFLPASFPADAFHPVSFAAFGSFLNCFGSFPPRYCPRGFLV